MTEQRCGTCKYGTPLQWKPHGGHSMSVSWVKCSIAPYPQDVISACSKQAPCSFNPSRWEPVEPAAA